jgi:hypothetical protein
MKLFELRLQESISEKEFTYNKLIPAKTQKSAEKKANQYARRFWSSYEDDQPVRKNKDGQYLFNGGEIVVEVLDVSETNKELFLEECYQRALIGKV